MEREIEWLLQEGFGGGKSFAFFAALERLNAGEPLGYILGFVPFLDCKIWLDSQPLIPRAESEWWTERAIKEISQFTQNAPPLRVLDLCAGSGCIGVAVAKALPEVYVDFSEIDLSHMPTIEKNLQENGITREHSIIYHTNLFTGLTDSYDFILSNPPYIDPRLNRTDESVLRHEPHLALFGGPDGMECISSIIKSAPNHLQPHGQLWIEHEPEQTAVIHALAVSHGFSSTTHTDQYNTERYSILVLQ